MGFKVVVTPPQRRFFILRSAARDIRDMLRQFSQTVNFLRRKCKIGIHVAYAGNPHGGLHRSEISFIGRRQSNHSIYADIRIKATASIIWHNPIPDKLEKQPLNFKEVQGACSLPGSGGARGFYPAV
jgi:hypothetical protein